MRDAPLLIGYRSSNHPFVSADAALEEGCQGISFDLQPRPFGRSHSPTRASRYPRLQDIFHECGDRLFLDIEVQAAGLEAEILRVVRERKASSNYVVSSSRPEVLMELKARSDTISVGLICKRAAQLAGWRTLPADYVLVHHPLITRRLVLMVHNQARKIFAWRVNDVKTMIRLALWGVDGIISNHPKRLAQTAV
jgi:glycerophosphoryl diester phosphodiesterase